MLSKAALRAGTLAVRAQASKTGVLVASRPLTTRKLIDDIDKANATYFGPERDTKNFPHPKMAETHPPVRMGVIPESWFTALYDKTGVTGPYVLGAGFLTFLFSKEIWIMEHNFIDALSAAAAAYIICTKAGPSISKYIDNYNEKFRDTKWNNPLAEIEASCQETIKASERAVYELEGQAQLFEAKKENVGLQLEAIYRQRLNDVYQNVKKRLDYQVDVENTKRRFEQEHMVNWIVDGVRGSITPQQEKDALNKCISDLKAMAAKA